jgi:hypothetical protein
MVRLEGWLHSRVGYRWQQNVRGYPSLAPRSSAMWVWAATTL